MPQESMTTLSPTILVGIISLLSLGLGFMVSIILWGIKRWQDIHDKDHTDLDHRIDKLTECVSINKRDIVGMKERCFTRCVNEDDIFREMKQAIKDTSLSMNELIAAIYDFKAKNESSIAVLTERINQIDKRHLQGNDDGR
jgi:hypothetical protein